jgi:hypothetical protein
LCRRNRDRRVVLPKRGTNAAIREFRPSGEVPYVTVQPCLDRRRIKVSSGRRQAPRPRPRFADRGRLQSGGHT